MKISVQWLNQYLQPSNVSADEAEAVLMGLGLPTETREPVEIAGWGNGKDIRMDVEVTSNRGDTLCHVGMAREIAAKTGRTLVLPKIQGNAAKTSTQSISECLSLTNAEPSACPLFTARVIRGVKVGPSPDWLRHALEAVGQRSISNVVDVTNYISLELGNPCHVFDLATLEGKALVVRFAKDKEVLTTLDGKKRTLAKDELVVADAVKAQSLAGVMGGADSQVTDSTVDVVLEMATWDPVTVRRAARRHALRTDASYRFERYVDARTIQAAAERAAAMIIAVAGGELCEGALSAGQSEKISTSIRLRPMRVSQILGVELEAEDIAKCLSCLEIQVGPLGRAGDELLCTVPPYRADLTREIDLIEEIARLRGLDAVEMQTSIRVSVKSPQESERARRELCSTLTGLGFYETVTFSFVSREVGKAFVPSDMRLVEVSEDRRKNEPVCRPSVIPGLLGSRRANLHGGVHPAGGVRLFEISAVFGQDAAGKSLERQNVALLLDAPCAGKKPTTGELQTGVRLMRGVIESVVRAMGGVGVEVKVAATKPHCSALSEVGYARVMIGGKPAGYFGIVSTEQAGAYDLSTPMVVGELSLEALTSLFPAKAIIKPLPAFPSIERDVSFIVDEEITWDRISGAISALRMEKMESVGFVGTFRGAQIGKGKKSVTVRLAYRDEQRTLRHEEIDAPVAAMVESLKGSIGASVRA